MSFAPFGGLPAVIPPIALTAPEHGWTRAAVLFAIIFVVKMLGDNVVKPKVMGKGLGTSPLAIGITFLLWAYVLGPMGAILAIPLTIVLHQTCRC